MLVAIRLAKSNPRNPGDAPKFRSSCAPHEQLSVARKNVEMNVAGIRKDSPVLAEMEAKGSVKMTGAMYNLETGAVEFFE
jgi:carbonic anhydrase